MMMMMYGHLGSRQSVAVGPAGLFGRAGPFRSVCCFALAGAGQGRAAMASRGAVPQAGLPGLPLDRPPESVAVAGHLGLALIVAVLPQAVGTHLAIVQILLQLIATVVSCQPM